MAHHSSRCKRSYSDALSYCASDAYGSSPIGKAIKLRVDTKSLNEIGPKLMPTVDTELDTGSPATLHLFDLLYQLPSDNFNESFNTAVVGNIPENAAALAVQLGYKVEKRNKQLKVAWERVQALNKMVQDAAECESKLRDEIHTLVIQQGNWRRAGCIVQNMMTSAEAFPPDSTTVRDYAGIS